MARGRITRRVFAQQAAAAAASLVWGGSVASRAANASSADELDEALRLLSRYGPEFGGGLANHGPMACEALVALGRKESVLPWVQGYRRRLQDRPPQRERLDESSVLAALGKHERVADLTAFFRRELDEAPWREVLARWVPVLAPGLSAVAFHGVIRTGHAVRSLDRAEGKKRVAELADGLGYWAANFHALPGAPPSPAPAPARTASAEEALGALVRIPPERRRRGNLVA